MILKSSFLVSLKENNKRRIAVWLLALLGYILLVPVATAISLKQVTQDFSAMVEAYGENVAQKMLMENKLEAMRSVLGFSDMLIIVMVVLAVVSAFQGFSWLYSRKKVDFYLGLPVKRNKRFWVIWMNGVLTMLLPYALGLIVGLVMAAGNGACDGSVLMTVLLAYAVISLMGLCVYHLALLAVLLTGNGVIAGLGFLVFCLYEFFVRTVAEAFQQEFFRYKNSMFVGTAPAFSPFTMIENLVNAYHQGQRGMGTWILQMLIFALIVGAIVWICYRERPAEAIGRAMAFRWMEAPLKLLLVIPASLLTAVSLAEMLNLDFIGSPFREADSAGFMVPVLIISSSLLCALIQAIFEFDVKAILHRKSYMILCSALTILIFLFFRYDILGYDAWVPAAKEIKSTALIPNQNLLGSERFGKSRIDENGNNISFTDYVVKNMELKDADAVCHLAKRSMEGYEELIRSREAAKDSEGIGEWVQISLVYRLQSGRTAYRKIYINVEDDETVRLLDRLMETKEFQDCFYEGMSDQLERQLDKEGNDVSVTYTNWVYQQPMPKTEVKEFLSAYRKDVSKTNYTRLKEDIPAGIVLLEISNKLSAGVTRTRYSELRVQSFYENSIAWLQEHGYYMDTQFVPEDIERIQVRNRHLELSEKDSEKNTGNGRMVPNAESAFAENGYQENKDAWVIADYSDIESIRQIARTVCPTDLYECVRMQAKREENYQIIVYFKSDSQVFKKYGDTASYQFLYGQVPLFVQEDTAYPEQR